MNNNLKCPVCESTSTASESSAGEIRIRRCSKCRHCFTDLSSIDKMEEYGPDYFTKTHKNWFANPDFKLFEKLKNTICNYKKDATVLDVGCGNGNFLKYLSKQTSDLSLVGIDLVKNESDKRIQFLNGDFQEYPFNQQFDVVVSLAVIEHIQDVRLFVKKISELVKKNGLVIIMTINEQGLVYSAAKTFNKVGFKAAHERLFSHHHVNHFNVLSLTRLIENYGLVPLKTFTHNSPIAAVDFEASNKISKGILKTGVWGLFKLGNLSDRALLQTSISVKQQS